MMRSPSLPTMLNRYCAEKELAVPFEILKLPSINLPCGSEAVCDSPEIWSNTVEFQAIV